MSKLDKLNAHIRRWGWWRTLYFLVMRAAARYLRLELFVLRVRDTAATNPENPCRLSGVIFREVDADEILALARDPDVPLGRGFVRAATRRGDLAFGAFKDESLIAYLWRSTTTAPHNDACWVSMSAPYSYSYNSFAKPEFRGQRIVPGLLLYSDEEMMKKGYTHRAGIVATSNFASLAMGKHLGSQVIGRIAYANWFGRIRYFRSRSVTATGFNLVPKPGKMER